MIKYIDKKNTYIDSTVTIGDNTIIYPNVMIEGSTVIGSNCTIHMGSYIKDSTIGDNSTIYNSYVIESVMGTNNTVGPYANIRSGNKIGNNNKIGAFVELKNNIIKNNNKIPHHIYLGDSEIGSNVNIGCGVITANFDGIKKNKTIIKDKSFIGCNVSLIAPVIIGEESIVAAGSIVVKDVPPKALAIARKEQINKLNYNMKDVI